jgi:hypothetical protein
MQTHAAASRTGTATSKKSAVSVQCPPNANRSESARDSLRPLGRTDYLLKDKTASMASLRKRDGLRMETSYDLMSREIWRMAQQPALAPQRIRAAGGRAQGARRAGRAAHRQPARARGPGSAQRPGSVVRSPVDEVYYYGTVNGCPVPVLKGAPRISRTQRYDH